MFWQPFVEELALLALRWVNSQGMLSSESVVVSGFACAHVQHVHVYTLTHLYALEQGIVGCLSFGVEHRSLAVLTAAQLTHWR